MENCTKKLTITCGLLHMIVGSEFMWKFVPNKKSVECGCVLITMGGGSRKKLH